MSLADLGLWSCQPQKVFPANKKNDSMTHIEGSNADFSSHMEGSHADFALHMERRHSFRDQQISKIAISSNFNKRKMVKPNLS